MELDEDPLDPQDVERAKVFWAREDVDQVFEGVFEYLDHLRRVLKKNTATDKEYVQGLKLLRTLDCPPPASAQDSSVVQVVIGSGELLLPDLPHHGPPPPLAPSDRTSSSAAPPAGREELLPPLTPVQLEYRQHSCCRACLSGLPSMPQSTPPFWGQNPLKVPLLCGFKRLTAVPMTSPPADQTEPAEDRDAVYKAPCGQSLRNHDDVMRFLEVTESYDLLQADFFTFNPSVRLDPPPSAGPQWPELDLSRGVEPTPVELCVGDGGVRPADFRYRKERWPHGCFLSRGPALFTVCCDCSDGCADAERCACAAATRGGRRYSHLRLDQPVPSGVYECGPWCGCDRARCQNRLVQRGVRVRLQVFQTADRGWGVRCRDDLDSGTFVCVYAGVILQRVQSPAGPPSPKQTKAELPSDDEVEVVTEWLVPPVKEPTAPPLHVPVIQRPADTTGTLPQDRDKSVLVGGPESPGGSVQQAPAQEETGGVPGLNGTGVEAKSLKRALKAEDVNFLDASKEGNVSRFFNHSCTPNLFIQNVFTDSHDPAFPVIAFFTNRVVKARSELTWNYSAHTQRKQEVACLCGSAGCQGRFSQEEALCEACEAEGPVQPAGGAV